MLHCVLTWLPLFVTDLQHLAGEGGWGRVHHNGLEAAGQRGICLEVLPVVV